MNCCFRSHCLVSVLATLLLLGLAKAGDIPISVVTCDTTKGEIEMTFYRDYSPKGYDRAVKLFKKGFFDHSHFFRVVPRFLVQFGISYTQDKALQKFAKTPIPDDPPIQNMLFEPGLISFAGSGPNSRTSHLFISYITSSQLGTNPWETPIGRVTKGMDIVRRLHSGYGDMPPWGKGPEQGPIYDGPKYIEENFPKLDRFLTCKVRTLYTTRSNLPPGTVATVAYDSSESLSDSDDDEEYYRDDEGDEDREDGADEL